MSAGCIRTFSRVQSWCSSVRKSVRTTNTHQRRFLYDCLNDRLAAGNLVRTTSLHQIIRTKRNLTLRCMESGGATSAEASQQGVTGPVPRNDGGAVETSARCPPGDANNTFPGTNSSEQVTISDGAQILTPEGTAKLCLAGFNLEGLSIGGQETCIAIPSLRIAFDIGRCPQRAVFQDNLLISHAHLDHLGGIGFYVATRRMLTLKKALVLMPPSCVDKTEQLLTLLSSLEDREAEPGDEEREEGLVKIEGIGPGEERRLINNLVIRPFRTFHTVPSQGYIVYSIKQKLRAEFIGLPPAEIKRLKASGVQITDTVEEAEVAFTGDTTGEFITCPQNADALKAKLLIMELTFVDDSVSIEDAHHFGHTHISEVVEHAEKFQNQAVLFIHFSARYKKKDIVENLNKRLPESLRKRACALTVRFG